MTLTLYTHPMSPCSQKVRIVLAEKSLEWEKYDVKLPEKENTTPWYTALNPKGVIPTLVHNDKPVIESSIICEYLEDNFPDPVLRPEDTWLRARMRTWMNHIDEKLHNACGALTWPLVIMPDLVNKPREEIEAKINQMPEKPRRDRQRSLMRHGLDSPYVIDAVPVYEKTIADMEVWLQQYQWLAGDDFTLADASMAPYFQTLYQFGWLEWYESRPRVTDWYYRCRERDSYQQEISADFPEQVVRRLRAKGRECWPVLKSRLPVESTVSKLDKAS